MIYSRMTAAQQLAPNAAVRLVFLIPGPHNPEQIVL
jgi:hypothetical protein